ncbi:MAG: MATE family efflux transporter, partial [Bacteroidia bacterium]|nr:MATE family efflux transporter [Bacteroidia bacterium]
MRKQIFHLAIPNILNNLTVPLLGIVDAALMGRLDDPAYLGAVALGGSIFSFLYWGFGFLRMSTVGLTGQAHGRKDGSEVIMVLVRAAIVGLFAALVILLFQRPIAVQGLALLGVAPELEAVTRDYVLIRIWAAPAVFLLFALQGWFLGMQNAKYPLYLALVVNGANIGFNLFFVKVMNMTTDGVALGTLLAQYCGLITGVGLFAWKYKSYLQFISQVLLRKWEAYSLFFNVSRDIFLRTICLIVVFTFFNVKSAQLGEIQLDANHILLQFFFILSFGVDGFA